MTALNGKLLEAGLKVVQGKCVVNSISLKEGEDLFINQAKLIRRYGAAVIIMAFDEKGQADNLERRIEICERSYNILVNKVGFPPDDIIFDPNIFPVATGMEEHKNNALDFLMQQNGLEKTYLMHLLVEVLVMFLSHFVVIILFVKQCTHHFYIMELNME